ncbi:hypothetical protein [Flagellimonas baculiformis]|uniref:hypothetical protein n=1 Tax=Flagellimonas baculiformis TaxID=3067310 RepID=UPI00296E79F5|nr:hypothetical protein [Muricauda sp. D6]
MKIMKIKYSKHISILSILLISSLINTSCFDDNDFGSDVSKVVPFVFNFTGPNVGFVGETVEYSVRSRGGSEFVWTVDGAEMQVVPGEPNKVNVTFNQFADPVSVSVYEVVANGSQSEASSIDVTVFGVPCTWTVELQDAYGDGWNGASLSFSYDGVPGGEITLGEGAASTETIDIPDGSEVEVTFNSGDWDEEVTFQIYDANGNLVLDDGPTPTVGVVVSQTNNCP